MQTNEVLHTAWAANYKIFESTSKDYNLNLIGIRDPTPELDDFGCRLWAIWKTPSGWKSRDWQITTLPGSRYMKEVLLNREGCAILKPGQYLGCYKVRLHRGQYRAVCQDRPVQVYRDGNRDDVFDLDPAMLRSGNYGINIHQPGQAVASSVYNNSAGCQVFKRRADFREYMWLVERSIALWGNRLTYSLLDAPGAGGSRIA
jgi:hypothetical protein